jgi:hypothetical protein
VGIFKRDPGSTNAGKMMIRTWSTDEIITPKNFAFLKAKNSKGEDIFIRPSQNQPTDLILVDDLELYFIEQMQDDAISPIIITETSPSNHQIYIKSGVTDQNLRVELSRLLAEKYSGDAASVDAYHFARLAGFTNQKQKYKTRQGKQPFVLLRRAVPPQTQKQFSSPSPGLKDLLKIAAARINTNKEQHLMRCDLIKNIPTNNNNDDVIAWAQTFYDQLSRKFGAAFDQSRGDWMLCINLFKRGYSTKQVSNILLRCSNISRKRNADDYINRTVRKAASWHKLRLAGASWDDVRNDL